MTPKGWGYIVCGGLGLLLVGSAAFSDRTPASPDNAESACYRAWQAVRENLKAPASADFSSCQDGSTAVTADQGGWLVAGRVDAQNTFGTSLRHNYSVRMTYGPSGWSYSDLKISAP